MFCNFCKKELKQSSSSTGKYCNNTCQANHKKEIIIEQWKNNYYQINLKVPKCIKNYILEKQEYKCAICNMSNEWNKKPIVFICDHIDGNSQNNKEENLRLVCPNCDSQLDTFKGKNKGNGRFYRRIRYKEKKSY